MSVHLKQVKEALLKAYKGTSAGPDTIDLAELRSVGRQGVTLTNLFNTWLLTFDRTKSMKTVSSYCQKAASVLIALTHCIPGNFSFFFCRPLIFFKIKFFQEYHQNVKQFGR